MTTYSRTTVDCDFEPCGGRSDYTLNGAAKAREQATAMGWKRFADLDFCGRPDTSPYAYYTDDYYKPRNHADLLTGDHKPTLVRMPPQYSWSKVPQWRVSCACGWDDDAKTPRHSKSFAAKSWIKHVAAEMKKKRDGASVEA